MPEIKIENMFERFDKKFEYGNENLGLVGKGDAVQFFKQEIENLLKEIKTRLQYEATDEIAQLTCVGYISSINALINIAAKHGFKI